MISVKVKRKSLVDQKTTLEKVRVVGSNCTWLALAVATA